MERMHQTKAKDYPLDKYCCGTVTDEFIIEVMAKCDAIWIHDGDPKSPHAELTSGKCSNGFFNCLKALKYINLNEIFAYHLAQKIREEIGEERVDWVLGSPMAGITFGYAVARHLGAPIFMFAEKDPSDKNRMLWQREIIPAGDNVLQIEELITTAKTLNAVQAAVEEGNPYPVNWLPVIGVFVHRPAKLPVTHYGNRKVVALFEKEIWAKDPPCELCLAGSSRYRPKTHWPELTGKR